VVPPIPNFVIKWRVAFITQPVHLGEKLPVTVVQYGGQAPTRA